MTKRWMIVLSALDPVTEMVSEETTRVKEGGIHYSKREEERRWSVSTTSESARVEYNSHD